MSGKASKPAAAAKPGKGGKAPKAAGGGGLTLTAIVYGVIYGGLYWFGSRAVEASGEGMKAALPWLIGGAALFLVMLSNIATSGMRQA